MKKSLTEAMVPTSSLSSNNMSLVSNWDNYNRDDYEAKCYFVLYDNSKYFRTSSLQEACVAFVILEKNEGPCRGSLQVTRSFAEKGYGPTIYDLVMSFIPEGITSDRTEVSPEACILWKNYFDRADIKKAPIVDMNSAMWNNFSHLGKLSETIPDSNGENYLNYVYNTDVSYDDALDLMLAGKDDDIDFEEIKETVNSIWMNHLEKIGKHPNQFGNRLPNNFFDSIIFENTKYSLSRQLLD